MLCSPAAWLFSTAWLLALAYLTLAGYGAQLLLPLSLVLLILVLSLLTIPLTMDAPASSSQTTISKVRLWVQLIILMLFILFTGYRGILLNGALSVQASSIPAVAHLVVLSARFPLDAVNPLLYFVLPMLLLLLIGVRWREVGFAPGHRVWAVTLLWCGLPVVLIVISVLRGGTQLSTLGLALFHNSLRNGFFEEFLFRGAFMAVLIRLLDNRWGIVLSSLIFGLWHVGTNTVMFSGNFLAGVAYGMLVQALIGLGFAIVVYRTRNLLASSIIHVVFNAAFG